MKKLNLLLLGMALTLPVAARATIIGSAHDFSSDMSSTNATGVPYSAWNTNMTVCGVCHAAHRNNPDKVAPLWKHQTTAKADFIMYSSPTLDGVVSAQPSSASKACLSCHDGTLSINQRYSSKSPSGSLLGGVDGGKLSASLFTVNGVSGDMSTTHPISITYAYPVDPGLVDPSTPVTGMGGRTIAQAMLIGGRVECASCHDVHANKGAAATDPRLLIVTETGPGPDGHGSQLCRTCHAK